MGVNMRMLFALALSACSGSLVLFFVDGVNPIPKPNFVTNSNRKTAGRARTAPALRATLLGALVVGTGASSPMSAGAVSSKTKPRLGNNVNNNKGVVDSDRASGTRNGLSQGLEKLAQNFANTPMGPSSALQRLVLRDGAILDHARGLTVDAEMAAVSIAEEKNKENGRTSLSSLSSA